MPFPWCPCTEREEREEREEAEGEGGRGRLSHVMGERPITWCFCLKEGTALMTSSNPDDLTKAPSPNTITLGLSSTHEWAGGQENTIQIIAPLYYPKRKSVDNTPA